MGMMVLHVHAGWFGDRLGDLYGWGKEKVTNLGLFGAQADPPRESSAPGNETNVDETHDIMIEIQKHESMNEIHEHKEHNGVTLDDIEQTAPSSNNRPINATLLNAIAAGNPEP